jgi:hypothetical protein
MSGFTREQTLAFPEPEGVMRQFAAWIAEVGAGRPMFVSDNIPTGLPRRAGSRCCSTDAK